MEELRQANEDKLAALTKQLSDMKKSMKVLTEQMKSQQDVIELAPAINDLQSQTAQVYSTLTALSSQAMKQIEVKEKNWAQLQGSINAELTKAGKRIDLNVRGKIFSTSKENLLKEKDTYFTAMLGSGQWKPDQYGQYFVDRDPHMFKLIFQYLCTGRVSHKMLEEKWEDLKEEFDFFQVQIPDVLRNQFGQGKSLLNKSELPSLVSVVLDRQQTEVIADWLQQQQAGKIGPLLYRASEQGFEASSFHKYCDNKGPTIVIIKTPHGYVFGGYAGNHWLSDRSNSPNSDFMFTLANCQGGTPALFFPSCAHLNEPSYGPIFRCYRNQRWESYIRVGHQSDQDGNSYFDPWFKLGNEICNKTKEIEVFLVVP